MPPSSLINRYLRQYKAFRNSLVYCIRHVHMVFQTVNLWRFWFHSFISTTSPQASSLIHLKLIFLFALIYYQFLDDVKSHFHLLHNPVSRNFCPPLVFIIVCFRSILFFFFFFFFFFNWIIGSVLYKTFWDLNIYYLRYTHNLNMLMTYCV